MTNFSPAVFGGDTSVPTLNQNGSFSGADALAALPDIHITSDFQTKNSVTMIKEGVSEAAQRSYTGQVFDPAHSIIEGYTDRSNPSTNYINTGLIDPDSILETQIHELGNSLANITGTMPSKLNTPADDPGQKLKDCYTGDSDKK
jgi:hypothetical protein